MPMSRPVRRTRRKTVFTLVTVLFTSERDTNALYLQINPTRTRSQVDSTRLCPSWLSFVLRPRRCPHHSALRPKEAPERSAGFRQCGGRTSRAAYLRSGGRSGRGRLNGTHPV